MVMVMVMVMMMMMIIIIFKVDICWYLIKLKLTFQLTICVPSGVIKHGVLENGPLISDFAIQSSIDKNLSIALFDYQRVCVTLVIVDSMLIWLYLRLFKWHFKDLQIWYDDIQVTLQRSSKLIWLMNFRWHWW